MDDQTVTREYYRAIDADEYDALVEILAPAFVHDRPDRSIEGRDRFVQFMREDRPRRDTEHVVDTLYTSDAARRVAAEGRLLYGDGTEWFRFVDVFVVADGRIQELTTYTQG